MIFFKFLIKSELKELEGCIYGGMRYLVEAQIAKKRFVTFHVDVGISDHSKNSDFQTFHPNDWLDFAGIPPPLVEAVILEQTFAEKLHAYTTPRVERPNSRVRDLVDMIILIDANDLKIEKLMQSITHTFSKRNAHPFPKILPNPPEHWHQAFPPLAQSAGVDPDVTVAFKKLENYLKKNGISEKMESLHSTALNLPKLTIWYHSKA